MDGNWIENEIENDFEGEGAFLDGNLGGVGLLMMKKLKALHENAGFEPSHLNSNEELL